MALLDRLSLLKIKKNHFKIFRNTINKLWMKAFQSRLLVSIQQVIKRILRHLSWAQCWFRLPGVEKLNLSSRVYTLSFYLRKVGLIKLYIENITEIFVLVYLGEINIIESILNMWLIFIFCAKYLLWMKAFQSRLLVSIQQVIKRILRHLSWAQCWFRLPGVEKLNLSSRAIMTHKFVTYPFPSLMSNIHCLSWASILPVCLSWASILPVCLSWALILPVCLSWASILPVCLSWASILPVCFFFLFFCGNLLYSGWFTIARRLSITTGNLYVNNQQQGSQKFVLGGFSYSCQV
jgi:hypothetical protein